MLLFFSAAAIVMMSVISIFQDASLKYLCKIAVFLCTVIATSPNFSGFSANLLESFAVTFYIAL